MELLHCILPEGRKKSKHKKGGEAKASFTYKAKKGIFIQSTNALSYNNQKYC